MTREEIERLIELAVREVLRDLVSECCANGTEFVRVDDIASVANYWNGKGN